MPEIDKECILLLKGPKCCVLWNLEGSPRYRGGSCVICTGQAIYTYHTVGQANITVKFSL